MAKRKRLSPVGVPEITSVMEVPPNARFGGGRRAPIADVVGDAATRAAFDKVSAELQDARREGRLVLSLPLAAVEADHLMRDRVVLDPEDMAVLLDSLRARGQQTPVEVVDLGAGRYGLISGWRRLTALHALHEETGEDRFAEVKALVRAPDGAAEAYRAMVEENEVRADLSFYERAQIACKAVEQGIYPDVQAAVYGLFASARAPKRSKIVAFATLVGALGPALRFPAAVPEKVGLALVTALQTYPTFRSRLVRALDRADPQSAVEEREIINQKLKKTNSPTPKGDRATAEAAQPVAPGLALTVRKGQIVLSGPAVTADLVRALRDWLAKE